MYFRLPKRPKNSSKKTKKAKLVDVQANSGRSVIIAGTGRIQELDDSSEDDFSNELQTMLYLFIK